MLPQRVIAALSTLVLLLAACGDDGTAAGGPGSTAADAVGLDGTLTILAATSLEGAFEEIKAAFEKANPGVEIELTTEGSANLATAIIEGGVRADVFASADDANLQKVVDAGLADGADAVTFVTNRVEIVVEAGNPLGIEGLEDLTDPSVSLSLCQEEVPCGRYARQAFEAAGLPVPPAGEEDKVSGVLTKVALGEADVGLVYVTDILAADDVEGVALPADQEVVATYPAAVLGEAPHPEAAAAFVAFLTSAPAQEILVAYGFGRP